MQHVQTYSLKWDDRDQAICGVDSAFRFYPVELYDHRDKINWYTGASSRRPTEVWERLASQGAGNGYGKGHGKANASASTAPVPLAAAPGLNDQPRDGLGYQALLGIAGRWKETPGPIFEISDDWTASKVEGNGKTPWNGKTGACQFGLRWDEKSEVIRLMGRGRSLCFYAADLANSADVLNWYSQSDHNWEEPSFVWKRCRLPSHMPTSGSIDKAVKLQPTISDVGNTLTVRDAEGLADATPGDFFRVIEVTGTHIVVERVAAGT